MKTTKYSSSSFRTLAAAEKRIKVMLTVANAQRAKSGLPLYAGLSVVETKPGSFRIVGEIVWP